MTKTRKGQGGRQPRLFPLMPAFVGFVHIARYGAYDAEVLAPVIGIEGFLTAPDATVFDREVQKIDLMMFNFVFADDQGTIAHHASGAVPIRAGRRRTAATTGPASSRRTACPA